MLLGFDFWQGACFVVEFCNLFRISTRTWLSGLVRGSFLWFLRSKSSGCIVIKVMAWGEKPPQIPTTNSTNHYFHSALHQVPQPPNLCTLPKKAPFKNQPYPVRTICKKLFGSSLIEKRIVAHTTEEDQGGSTSEEKYDNKDQLSVTVSFASVQIQTVPWGVWVQKPLLFLHFFNQIYLSQWNCSLWMMTIVMVLIKMVETILIRKVNKSYRGRSCPIIIHCRCY